MHEVAQRPSERRSLEVDFFRLNGFESYYKFTRDKNDENWVTKGAVAWGDVSRLRHSSPLPSPTPIFFSFFPQRRAWSQANTKPSLWVPITGTSTRFDCNVLFR